MTQAMMMATIERLVEEARCAVLATSSAAGVPSLRWMSPLVLPDAPGLVYAVSSAAFCKVVELGGNPRCHWMFQSRSLDEVVNAGGRINILENPSLRAQVVEGLGNRLGAFWKLQGRASDFLVLETVLEEAVHYRPMSGEKNRVVFREGADANN